ncbi:MAG: hypothetical protein VX755_08520, partial [Pseudomonadota bacterium]|nr:hypothetical protein [Pseudomonadota bacterium]
PALPSDQGGGVARLHPPSSPPPARQGLPQNLPLDARATSPEPALCFNGLRPRPPNDPAPRSTPL